MTGGGTADNSGWDYFVSYTQADQGWAEWIAWTLEDDGARTLIQAWDFGAGSRFVDAMHRAVDGAARTVMVLSAAYLRSAFTTAEWQAVFAADPSGQALLVVRVEACDRPGLLRQIVSVDVFDVGRPEARARLLATVHGERGKPAVEPAFPGPPGAPGVPGASGTPRVPGTAEKVGTTGTAGTIGTTRTAGTRSTAGAPGAGAGAGAGARAGLGGAEADAGTGGEPVFPADLPAVWNVPSRLVHFVGREELLDELHRLLSASGTATVVAVEGMGGVGKTAVALEYAYRHAAEFDVVWWVPAEQPDLVGQHVAGMAPALGLPADAEPATVFAALTRVPRWLLIFDNAEDPVHLAQFRPPAGGGPGGGGGRVLVTSRQAGWGQLGGTLPIPTLPRAESIDLLAGRFPGLDAATADRIADLLGDLPLAVRIMEAPVEVAPTATTFTGTSMICIV